jgi:hypothetical protein
MEWNRSIGGCTYDAQVLNQIQFHSASIIQRGINTGTLSSVLVTLTDYQLITYFGSTLYCTEKNRVHGMEPEHLPVARMAARARARAYSL